MPADGNQTRARLAAEAERLFAISGVDRVTNREIIEAAGQKNTSALSYHFGSRADLLAHILREHGQPIDLARGEMSAGVDEESSTSDILRALVVPYGAELLSEAGRYYLQIVDQLRPQMSQWRSGLATDDAHLTRLLELLSVRPAALPSPVREHRLVSMMMLMTAAVAVRARELAVGVQPELDHDTFVANLIDMCAGVVHAPAAQSVS